jgi:hypothetical protein
LEQWLSCGKLHQSGEKHSPLCKQQINKPAEEGRSGGTHPATLERERLSKVPKVWHRQVGLYTGENKRGMQPGELYIKKA